MFLLMKTNVSMNENSKNNGRGNAKKRAIMKMISQYKIYQKSY